MTLAVHMVDVFGAGPFSGNPLAVVIGADAMSTDEMQQLTRWFNLSETAFLLSPTHPDADYRVRIFTLDREMPFAGHPTLGSCHVWLSTGRVPKKATEIIQECRAGLVTIRRAHGRISFAAPPLIRSGAPTQGELDGARQLLGIEPCDILDAAWIDNGPGWLGIRLASAEKVLSLNPKLGRSDRRWCGWSACKGWRCSLRGSCVLQRPSGCNRRRPRHRKPQCLDRTVVVRWKCG